jgi:hypothetical protein
MSIYKTRAAAAARNAATETTASAARALNLAAEAAEAAAVGDASHAFALRQRAIKARKSVPAEHRAAFGEALSRSAE